MVRKQNGLRKPPALSSRTEAFIDEQAVQCGYCYNGMIIKASGFCRRCPGPIGSADPVRDEWAVCAVRNVSTNPEGDRACFADDFGSAKMRSAFKLRNFLAAILLKAGGALIIVSVGAVRCSLRARMRRIHCRPGPTRS